MEEAKKFETLKEFYPYYLSEHRNSTCRLLHFIGTSMVISFFFTIVFTGQWKLLWLVPVIGYGPAWIGHFFFEKNRPATFKYPLKSLLSDFIMFWQILTGKL